MPPVSARRPQYSGLDNPALVKHHHVAGLQVVQDIYEHPVADLAGYAVENQEPGGVAGFHGSLGDQIRGEVVVEIVGPHGDGVKGQGPNSAATAPAGSWITQKVAPPMERGPSITLPPNSSQRRALSATSATEM